MLQGRLPGTRCGCLTFFTEGDEARPLVEHGEAPADFYVNFFGSCGRLVWLRYSAAGERRRHLLTSP